MARSEYVYLAVSEDASWVLACTVKREFVARLTRRLLVDPTLENTSLLRLKDADSSYFQVLKPVFETADASSSGIGEYDYVKDVINV